jgi:hypothetical protein
MASSIENFQGKTAGKSQGSRKLTLRLEYISRTTFSTRHSTALKTMHESGIETSANMESFTW